MNLNYFRMINNTYKSKSKQETELWLINRNEERWLYDNVDKQDCLKNDEPYEMLIIKGSNDYTKKIKAKQATPFNLGDYIRWKNQVWIVTSLDTDDKVHCSGTMSLCTIALHWQRKDGTVIERWAYSEDFTKYDSGKLANGVITIATNQYGMTVPIDNETKKLKRDMRFAIDFDDAEIPDIYTLSNRKVVLHNNSYFGRGGTMILTMTFDAFDATKDHRVEMKDADGNILKTVWVCDYEETDVKPNSDVNVTAYIDGTNETYLDDIGYWNVKFYDKNEVVIPEDEITFSWEPKVIVPEGFDDSGVALNRDGLEISLHVTDLALLGEVLRLQIILNNTVLATKKIEVLGGF